MHVQYPVFSAGLGSKLARELGYGMILCLLRVCVSTHG